MIRRHSRRPSRRQPQDFHFYAAGDPTRIAVLPALSAVEGSEHSESKGSNPTADLESQLARPTVFPPEPPKASDAVDAPEPSIEPTQPSPSDESPAEVSVAAPPLPPTPSAPNNVAKRQPKPRVRKRASPAPQGRSNHERHCTICSRRDRADIESDFIEWRAPDDIADEYKLSRAAIYRHARAVGLFERRNRNLRFALGRLIQNVDYVEPTADSIVRAIHAFARVSDEGEWIEPPAHVIVSSGGVRREAAVPPSRRPIAIPLDSQTASNVIDVTPEPALPETVSRVETDATR